MKKQLLNIFLIIGIVLIPFAFKREKLKDWLLIFFLKGYISSFISFIVVNNKQISYPIRFMPKFFKISIIFEYLLFPLLCVFYNRTSLTSKPVSILIQSMLYSMPITIIEVLLERKTDLIKYHSKWNWKITFLSLVTSFLGVRGFMYLTRKLNIEIDDSSYEGV
ncbi:CBO0543 family protein [Salirhabdus salicampi]|uniref:CBO0543 family protein n=1 Tax=Salirhabdus salicampi TaxID=476102 RepID=UPI0034629CFD